MNPRQILAAAFFSLFATCGMGSERPCYTLTVGRDGDSSSTASVTAVKVKQGSDDVTYIVGAYHTLVDGKQPIVNMKPFGEFNLDPRFGQVRDIYYNIVEDIFIARVNAGKGSGIKACELSEKKYEGYVACAVGNPTVIVKDVVYSPYNITYNCTISEYGLAEDRIAKLLVDKSILPAKTIRLLDSAKQLERLFVETLSVKIGFSGGPVLTSTQNEKELHKVIGIIVAGTQDVAPGRFAIVCPSDHIRNMIEEYEALSKSAGSRSSSDHFGILRNDEFDKINWKDSATRERYLSPYRLSQYSSYDTVVMNGKYFSGGNRAQGRESNATLVRYLSSPSSVRVIFNNCEFDNVDFQDSLLMYVTFRNCKFYGNVNFTNCAVSGCSFENCGFSSLPDKACDFLFGYRSIGDTNNYVFSNTFAFGKPPAGSVPMTMPGIDDLTIKKFDISEMKVTYGCSMTPEQWLVKKEMLMKYKDKLENFILSKTVAGESRQVIKRGLDPDKSRYSLTFAEIYLEIALCQLNQTKDKLDKNVLEEVRKSLFTTNSILELLDPTFFDADESRVYHSIVSIHRDLMLNWLSLLTNSTLTQNANSLTDPGLTPPGSLQTQNSGNITNQCLIKRPILRNLLHLVR